MGETELRNFIFLATLILLVFTSGIIVFIFQYYKRKVIHETEKAVLHEQHMHELLTTRLEIQQQTMQDIGREIHDNVGQRLTLASIYTHQLSYESQLNEKNDRVAEIGNIIDESLAELRSLSKNLTNPNTEVAELKDLLLNECKRINALNICQMKCTFNDADFTISYTIKNFILRIIQEFLQNSLKHANCDNIQMDFSYTAEGIKVYIYDDGKGFDAGMQNEQSGSGIGLLNMKKRAELIGASFTLTSAPGKGTSLQLLIPMTKLNAA